jgi:hypothetical protein
VSIRGHRIEKGATMEVNKIPKEKSVKVSIVKD